MRATVVLAPPMWNAVPSTSGSPRVVLTCPSCTILVRYDGLLTADGYGISPITCERCRAEYQVLLHGWRERGN